AARGRVRRAATPRRQEGRERERRERGGRTSPFILPGRCDLPRTAVDGGCLTPPAAPAREPGHLSAERPKQSSIRARPIEAGPGSETSSASRAAASSSRLNQRASAISSSWRVSSAASGAQARYPSISERGKGQGWLPMYWTSSTVIPTSSATS